MTMRELSVIIQQLRDDCVNQRWLPDDYHEGYLAALDDILDMLPETSARRRK